MIIWCTIYIKYKYQHSLTSMENSKSIPQDFAVLENGLWFYSVFQVWYWHTGRRSNLIQNCPTYYRCLAFLASILQITVIPPNHYNGQKQPHFSMPHWREGSSPSWDSIKGWPSVERVKKLKSSTLCTVCPLFRWLLSEIIWLCASPSLDNLSEVHIIDIRYEVRSFGGHLGTIAEPKEKNPKSNL